MRVGVKYCGGCNPAYDRGQWVADLKERLPDTVTLVRSDDRPDRILAVMGCPTACADLSELMHLPVFTLADPALTDDFLKWLNNEDTRR